MASVTHTVVAPAGEDYTATELKANFATLAAEHNALRTAVGNVVTALAALAVDAGAIRTRLVAGGPDLGTIRAKVNALLAALQSAEVVAAS